MFTTRHYREVARILHDSRQVAEDDHDTYQFWYDHTYTPFVKLFKADNERFDMLTFSWAVATGDFSATKSMRGDKLSGKTRETAEQVKEPS